ncbi:MAG: AAA family ATPase [Clostridia bacterium]|nr:AAA family ATPase [Clostridia bacterium]
MAKIISFSNQKGGVGKTTTCVNVAAQIAKKGKKVLLVDMDPQGNATSGLGVVKASLKCSIYDVLIGECPLKEAIIPTDFKDLSLVPATIDLAGAEIELRNISQNASFKRASFADIEEEYDYIFIDCPPSIGQLTVKALSVSDGVVLPTLCEFYSLEGLTQLFHSVKLIRQRYNPNLQVVGILLTMYNGRLMLTKEVVAEIKQYYADSLFKTQISRSVVLSEATGYGKPICYHAPYCKSALEYANVAKEIMMRI